MIAGATYREGMAFADGAVYIRTTAPSPAVPIAGSDINPPAKVVDGDGAVYVVFV